MAKTQIHQQEDALSVYFRDMLADHRPVTETPAPETEAPQLVPEAAPEITQAPTDSVQTEIKTTQGTDTTSVVTNHKLLLCHIGEMKLALDVSALSNIVHWPSAGLNQLPGRCHWQLGLFRDRDQHIEVVDIRHLLQTDQRDDEQQPGYILLINDRRIGIACDGISQIINIDDDNINWRHDTSQRPWFSGVIADSMHSIIDLTALFTALEQGEMA